MREFLIVFWGNELSIGIILSNWLILEALGSFTGGKLSEKLREKVPTIVLFLLIFSISTPAGVYIIRLLKDVLGVSWGQTLGLNVVFTSSFLIFLPISFSHGALFILCSKFYAEHSSSAGTASVGRAYILETIGTIAGGLGFTYLLIPYLNSFYICLGISLLHLFLALALLMFKVRQRVNFVKVGSLLSVFFLTVVCAWSFLHSNVFHVNSVESQWPEQDVLFYDNSIYGNIAVTEKEDELTFFSNGIPLFSAPLPNIKEKEDFAHFSMLSHPDPENILIITGGLGGLIKEVLKHPTVKNIDYAELDPLLIEVAGKKRFSTSLTEFELNSSKVNVKLIDGRFFMKGAAPDSYDLIFIGIHLPSDLQSNRLFTEEFFRRTSFKLKKGGILVLRLPGSLTYLNEELKKLNVCIRSTLKKAYENVRVIPGELNIYLASNSSYISDLDAGLLLQRLEERNIETKVLTSNYLNYRLSPQKRHWMNESLEDTKSSVNRDFRPSGLLYSLSYWGSAFSKFTAKVFSIVEKVKVRDVLVVIVFFTFLFLMAVYKFRGLSRLSLPFSIASTGFAGMMFDIVIMFSFQIMYGYVFYWMGILISTFIFGTAIGAFFITRNIEKIKNNKKVFLLLESGVILFALVVPFVFKSLHTILGQASYNLMVKAIFILLTLLSGALVGSEYPLANKIYTRKFKGSGTGETAGLLYSADLLGGWFGGILGGVILLPVLGLENTFFTIIILKISSLVVFSFLHREK